METKTLTLVEFLLARLDHEEAWYAHRQGACACPMNSDVWSSNNHRPGCPKRALAECDAKRRIVEGHGPWHVCPNISNRGGQDYEGFEVDLEPCPTLRLLALPYSDHPDYDYRAEWRP